MQRVVLHLARLTGWKGQRVLIEALALPPLAGRADSSRCLPAMRRAATTIAAQLEALIDARGLDGRVGIVGHCDDAAAAFALADVAVVASTEAEAFGRTAVEAAAMGVPVVATALGATAETVLAPPRVAEEERTGWLVPPGDAAALAAAIAAALALSGGARRALARARPPSCRRIFDRRDAGGDACALRPAARTGRARQFLETINARAS